jgi:hypothetical protein
LTSAERGKRLRQHANNPSTTEGGEAQVRTFPIMNETEVTMLNALFLSKFGLLENEPVAKVIDCGGDFQLKVRQRYIAAEHGENVPTYEIRDAVEPLFDELNISICIHPEEADAVFEPDFPNDGDIFTTHYSLIEEDEEEKGA